MIKKILFVLLLLSSSVQAKELSGVKLDEQVMAGTETLTLNGAGIRTKFVFDIYVAAFYTVSPVKKVADLDMQKPMRMAMHFVYDEVSKEKLVDGWNDGFEDNLSSEQFEKLSSKIKQFNALFETARAGDVINLDYVPSSGTKVSINQKIKGKVEGADFYHALLLIWLGEDPVGEDLKDALLGKTESDNE